MRSAKNNFTPGIKGRGGFLATTCTVTKRAPYSRNETGVIDRLLGRSGVLSRLNIAGCREIVPSIQAGKKYLCRPALDPSRERSFSPRLRAHGQDVSAPSTYAPR